MGNFTTGLDARPKGGVAQRQRHFHGAGIVFQLLGRDITGRELDGEEGAILPSAVPRQEARQRGDVMANTLYYGDNLDVLRDEIASDSVDLIYLDPPFNSQANYNVLFKSPAGKAADA